MKCTCGNPEMDFNCVCEWVKEYPGAREFMCEFDGLYKASQPRCGRCEEAK